jgi:hypothetical protein
MSPPTAPSSYSLPMWLTALVLLLVLFAGGWGAWRYFDGGNGDVPASAAGALTDANVVAPPGVPGGQGPWQGQRPPNFAQFAARIAANMPDGIMPAGNAYLVKAGTARLDIDRPNGNGPRGDWRYRFSYAIPDLIPPDQAIILRTGRRALTDAAAAQRAGATAEQIQQLRTIPGGGVGGTGMVVDAADRAKISTLFHAWLAASGRSTTTAPSPSTQPMAAPSGAKAAEQALVTALSDLGKRQLAATRQNLMDRAGRVRAILGDGLIQKLKPPG